MSALSEVEEDFIGETLDILTDLCRSCGELKGAGSAEDRWRNIQRGLHTIKGNSPAFGFEEFGEMASGLLEKVKAASDSGAEQQSTNLAPLVLEFVTRSRQYLGLVREGRSRPFFGGIFKSLRDQLDEEPARDDGQERGGESDAPSSPRGDARGKIRRPSSKGGSSLTAKLVAILESAPPIKPNLEQLSKLAARRLKLKSGRAAADERPRRAVVEQPGHAPTSPNPDELKKEEPLVEERKDTIASVSPPFVEERKDTIASVSPPLVEGDPVRRAVENIAPPVPAESEVCRAESVSTHVETREVSPEVAGLAFEALCAREAASVVGAEVDQNADLNRQMTRVTDFLADFCQWAREQQMVPLQESLDRCVEDLRDQAKRAGLKVEISAERTSRRVLPLLGELARHAITELLIGLSLLGKRDEANRSLTLSVSESSGRGEIRISGAGGPAALATRLRVYPVKRRLEEIGGDLLTGSPDEDLVVILPENIHSLDVCLVRSGASHVGIPGHRVIGTTTIPREDVKTVGSECRCLFESEEIGVLDLTDSPMREAEDEPKERCLVVLRGGSQRRGLIVDEFLGQGEMLVLLNTGPSQEGDIVGSCFAASEERTVPLLDFNAPRETATESHRS